MFLLNTSQITNKRNGIHLPITETQFAIGWDKWMTGLPVETAFPDLTDTQIDFIRTGSLPSEFIFEIETEIIL